MSSLFAPSIKDIIPLDKIPPFLSFAEKALEDLLEEIFYEDLVVYQNYHGDHGYYELTIILYTKLGVNFPGGFALVVNPDIDNNLRTEIPVFFQYKWEAIRYLNQLDLENFDPSPRGFFDLLKKIVSPKLEELLAITLDVFVPGANGIQTFLTSLNANYGKNVSTNAALTNGATQILHVANEISRNGLDLFEVLFTDYINVGTVENVLDNIKLVFSRWLGTFDFHEFLRIVTPEFELGIDNIDIALEFPPNVVRQINPDGTPKKIPGTNLDVKSVLIFNVGKLFFSTKEGFTFQQENTFDFPLSEIGKTGLTLSISKAAIDISNNDNTLPGTGGYPSDFKGLYIQEIIIGLPPFWAKEGDDTANGIDIFGRNLLIGGYDNNGSPKTIFTGTIGLEGTNSTTAFRTKLPGGLKLALNSFSLTFDEDGLDSSTVVGTLTIPIGDDDKDVNLTGQFSDSGFSLSATSSGGLFTVNLGQVATLVVHYVTIGSENGKFFFSLKTSLQLNIEFPLLDKFIPNPIVLEELKVSENGIEKFDINLSWNSADEVDMSSVLGDVSVVLPIDLNIFDIIEIYTLKIGISDAGNGKVSLKTLVDGRLSIGNKGPVVATVGDIGMETLVSYKSDNTGNLGPLDLEFKFVPPTKIGLSIDAKAVTGGGAVWFDFDNERYVGALELTVKNTIGIVVVGIMSFKRPDGTKGFSLLLLVSVEFATVQLGMGFVLTGVGGLLGINRGMNPDVLRDGIRTGLLDHILFPSDPVANIDAIVTGLESAFPQRQHQFIIGPMLQMGWGGAKSLVKLEIGLLIELFNPVKIAIPGVLSIELPDEEAAVVAIFVNFIGIIDFQEKFASFDASLFGSHILQEITLSGDMAFRLKWGDEPDFLFSMGGFHPEYTPPPLKLPNMARIGVSLLNLDNAQVGFELYFAVTTNSVQAGAAVFAEFRAGKFAVVGRFSFDVLFEFNPFRMVISAELQAALEFGGFPILKIVAGVRLSGPTPWNVSGTASVAIIGIEFSIDFDHTFGENLDTTVPNIALMPLVRAELEKEESWRSDFPSGGKSMVQFRSVEGAEKVAAHPSGRFIVEQTIVPLNIQMDKYGQNGIADSNEYSITKVSAVSAGLPSEELSTSSISNLFAPDQHFELTDEEKIKGPSFERFASGVVIDKTDRLLVSRAVSKDVAYEQLLVQSSLQNSWETQEEGSTEIDDKTIFEGLSTGGAVGDSSLSSKNQAFREDIVWSKSTSHYIVNNITMQPFVSSSHLATVRTLGKSEAERLLGQILEAEPQLEDLLMIVEEHELDNSLLAQPANKTTVLTL